MKKALLIACVLFSASGVASALQPAANGDVRAFIKSSWEKTFRHNEKGEGTLIGLPKPYTVPSIANNFQEMYYWDTYFTGEGLILDGHVAMAANNVENMIYIIGLYGKMLNGNRAFFENRSQPPYLSMMVESVYKKTGDKEWLRKVLPGLRTEYHFWMTRRLTPCGLNRYSNESILANRERIMGILKKRLGKKYQQKTADYSAAEISEAGSHFIAEAESGWDFTPRFQMRCEDFCPVDLNANLFYYEKNFEYFCKELGEVSEGAEWAKKAETRKALIRKYCRDQASGLYFDYDFVNERRSDVVSAAVFSLLYARVLTSDDAAVLKAKALAVLEYPHGIATCAERDYGYTFQWSFPNAWAPLQYLTIRGLDNYGFKTDAKRIAEKYVSMVAKNYEATGNLWEKYNVVEGNVNVTNEYKMPPMMGWTAGIFVWASEYLKRADSQTVGFDFAELADMKTRVAEGDINAKRELDNLVKLADEYLAMTPEKVTDGDLPPSGDKHDFYAIGKYAWPNPNTVSGMPYVRIDCKINDEANGPRFDLARYNATVDRIKTLSRAWFYTHDEKYAGKAAQLLRVWFLDEETRMNPNFECAAALPGVYNGMEIGIIFGVRLIEVVDHVGLLASAKSWSANDNAALRQWFSRYVEWLRTSKFGMKERIARNNHGTWYSAQVAAGALYSGETEIARELVEFGKQQIEEQMAVDGSLPHELKREWAFSYSVYAMQAFTTLARCGDRVGVDLWNYRTHDGKGLQSAYEFLATYLSGKKKWGWGITREGEQTELIALPMMRTAAKKYNSRSMGDAVDHVEKAHLGK